MKTNISYFLLGAVSVIFTITLANFLRSNPIRIPLHAETEVKTAALMVENRDDIKFEERKPLPVSKEERMALESVTGIEIDDRNASDNTIIVRQEMKDGCTAKVTYIVSQNKIETHKSYLLEVNLDWPFIKWVAVRTANFDSTSKTVLAEVQYQEMDGQYGKGCIPVFPISIMVKK